MGSVVNFLVTSAGRRGRLVQLIQDTLRSLGCEGLVFATDLNPDQSAACYLADRRVQAPRVTDPGYIPFLLSYAKENNIRFLIPTIDTELSILAQNKSLFAENNIVLVVPDLDFCNAFRHKKTTEEAFAECGVLSPEIFQDLADIQFPLFAKLDDSSCSKGAQVVNSLEQATPLLAANSNYVFQPLIEGEEFTVDIYMDSLGNLISAVPRQRIEVRAGEVSKGKTAKMPLLLDAVKDAVEKLKKKYRLSGVICLQVIQHHNQFYFIEINPRFGGGYPLSHQSGANFFEYLIRDYIFKEPLAYSEEWMDGVLMLRYDGDVVVRP